MTAMDQSLWKVNSWKLWEQGSHLLRMGVQNERPGWMYGALGKYLQSSTAGHNGNGEGNWGGHEKPSQFPCAS